MCRLYSFRSTQPRKVECELIRAQNSLLAQSRCDAFGENHPDGWGLAYYLNGMPQISRQASPAFEDPGFRWAAARPLSTNVIAHVRKATVGDVRLENTHPFSSGPWVFAHNGTLKGFPLFRDDLLADISPAARSAISGSTDSEHVFQFLLSERARCPGLSLQEVVRNSVLRLVGFAELRAAGAHFALNLLLTDGKETVGVRWGRPMWFVERPEVHPCEVCGGALHVGEAASADYRAVVVASECVTRSEAWHEIPDRSCFRIDALARWYCQPLR